MPTRDRPDMLKRCLASVAVSLGERDELIVVDSASRQPDEVRAVAEAAGATYVHEPLPGAGRARNTGWRAARHDVIAFVDDDVFVDETWADGLRQALTDYPDAGFLTGRIEIPPEQRPVERPVAIKDDAEPHPIDRHFDGIIGHSANLAVRRAGLEAIGGFDCGMGPGTRFGGCDDLDLFDRLLAAGYLGWYAPLMRGWHDQWRTSRDVLKLDWGTGRSLGGRLAKLLRTDRRRARMAARVLFWRWGMWDAYRWARARVWVLSLSALLRVAGGVVGLAAGLTRRLHDGVYEVDEGATPRSGLPHLTA